MLENSLLILIIMSGLYGVAALCSWHRNRLCLLCAFCCFGHDPICGAVDRHSPGRTENYSASKGSFLSEMQELLFSCCWHIRRGEGTGL